MSPFEARVICECWTLIAMLNSSSSHQWQKKKSLLLAPLPAPPGHPQAEDSVVRSAEFAILTSLLLCMEFYSLSIFCNQYHQLICGFFFPKIVYVIVSSFLLRPSERRIISEIMESPHVSVLVCQDTGLSLKFSSLKIEGQDGMGTLGGRPGRVRRYP